VKDRVDRIARRLVPSLPVLTRNRVAMAAFDVIDRATSLPFPEFRSLPPNRLRIRVGVGSRILFNQAAFLEYGAGTVVDALKDGRIGLDSSVVDIGCGCGRFAHALRRFGFHGTYDGIDVDRELVAWCASFFEQETYRFHLANVYSEVYNPQGEKRPYRLPVDDGSADFVIGQSLLTHLLEDDLRNYAFESFRVLTPGGHMDMGVFCLEEMHGQGLLGGRWTFRHRVGNARVESIKYPEAAVAYEKEFLISICRQAGFDDVSLVRGNPQSHLSCRK
jgi:SAM-dependent methyltransferase